MTLAPRQETFLARYPRKLKLGVVLAVVLALGVGPMAYRSVASLLASKEAPVVQQQAAAENKDAGNGAENAAAAGASTDALSTSAEALNQQDDSSIKLVPAPDLAVTQDTPEGTLPKIAEDGRQPWQVYARPFNTSDKRPRIALVITELGLSRGATDAAIARMPTNVTLVLDSLSPVAGAWASRARQDGHEILLSLPMEPFDFPRSDPGANTLLTSLPNSDNLLRLTAGLRQASGYVGITTLSGSRFTTDPDKLSPVLDVIHQRGLMVFDARVAPHSTMTTIAHNLHVPVATGTMRIDSDLSPEGIDAALGQLEQTARLTGHAVGVTSPYPVVLDRVNAWLKDLPQRGVALAPISALVQ